MNLRPDQNEALAQHFNKMHPEMFKSYINNPKTGGKLKEWMQANNYQHPGMMQSSAVSPIGSAPVTSNLGMSPPQGIPHPLAPSARVSAGGQLISPTPQAESTGFKGYPYSKPNDMSINAMSADPNYGQFYGQMRTKYNVANTPALPPKSPVPLGSSGYFSADAFAEESANKAVAESIAESGTESAGASALSGPQMFFANMGLEAIPTRDRNKVNTPFGDQGSVPGILKGAGKGALLGASVDTAMGGTGMGIPTIAGAVIGGVTGAQGTFDSTSPRQVIASGVRRPSGGLLQVPKGLYG